MSTLCVFFARFALKSLEQAFINHVFSCEPAVGSLIELQVA